jgi:hypothetical protein
MGKRCSRYRLNEARGDEGLPYRMRQFRARSEKEMVLTGQGREKRKQLCAPVVLGWKSGPIRHSHVFEARETPQDQRQVDETQLNGAVHRQHPSILPKHLRFPRNRLRLLPAGEVDRLPKEWLRTVAEASRYEAEGVEGASAEAREVSVAGEGEEGEDMEDEFGGDGVEHGRKRLGEGSGGCCTGD